MPAEYPAVIAAACRGSAVYREGSCKGEAACGLPLCIPPCSGDCPANGTKAPGGGDRLFPLGADLLAQRIEADGADHDFLADHVARGAVDAERLGELHVLLDRLFHLVAAHVAFETRHVESDFLGDRERTRLVGGATSAQELLVKFDVL